VTCPIVIVGHQCRGQFEVDATKIVKYRRGIGTSTSTSTSSADDNEIIDLCNDEDGPKNAPIIKEEAVNPRPIIVNVKSEPNGYDDETIDHREDLSDLLDDCESKKDEKNEECQIVKRRRLDPSLEATVQCNEFWSVNEDHIQFTEQAFVKKAIFHINFFLDSTKKVNEGFSLFVGGGIAMPGFDPLPTTLDIEKIADWTCSELTDALTKENNSDWGASTTAKWLKNATVGSFVILRHEYPKCQFCPERLIVDGKYIGPVYVIGIITKKVVPWSEEERDVAENKMGRFSRSRWPIHTVCRVSWKRMGLKKSLDKTTQDYINHICQSAFLQICDDPKKVFAGGTTSERIRRDLWTNATIPISSGEFSDEFDYSKSVGREWVSRMHSRGQP